MPIMLPSTHRVRGRLVQFMSRTHRHMDCFGFGAVRFYCPLAGSRRIPMLRHMQLGRWQSAAILALALVGNLALAPWLGNGAIFVYLGTVLACVGLADLFYGLTV